MIKKMKRNIVFENQKMLKIANDFDSLFLMRNFRQNVSDFEHIMNKNVQWICLFLIKLTIYVYKFTNIHFSKFQ